MALGVPLAVARDASTDPSHQPPNPPQKKTHSDGFFKVLIATDVAARGIDIPEVDLVIQYRPCDDSDSYVHRSGRTGR